MLSLPPSLPALIWLLGTGDSHLFTPDKDAAFLLSIHAAAF